MKGVYNMLQSITVNVQALESMYFIWSSLKDREKIADPFLIALAQSPEMLPIYDDEFTAEGVRKVLSAISNRELMNKPNKAESRFWNYNMWMLEDFELCQLMVQPLKTLNLSHLLPELQDYPAEKVEVVFVPGSLDLVKKVGDKLYINFFMLKVDLNGIEPESFDGLPVDQFILRELRK